MLAVSSDAVRDPVTNPCDEASGNYCCCHPASTIAGVREVCAVVFHFLSLFLLFGRDSAKPSRDGGRRQAACEDQSCFGVRLNVRKFSSHSAQ
jgi:hypothetical protein